MERYKNGKLSRELTPEEVAAEMKDVDTSLPEPATVHRRALFSDRMTGGAEHRSGTEEEAEELPREQPRIPADPPRGTKPSQGT